MSNIEFLKDLYDLKELQTKIACRVYLFGTNEEFEEAKSIYSRVNDLYRKLGGSDLLAKEKGWRQNENK